MDTDTLAERLVDSTTGALEILTVALGHRLGLYAALHEQGPLSAPGLAEQAGIDARYAREWLEQQCVSGLLDCTDPTGASDERTYSVPTDHVPVLLDPDSTAYLAPLASMIAAAGEQLPALTEAYRTGGGVGWGQFGVHMRQAQADMNRPWFVGELGRDWLPAVPGVAEALGAGGRVADIGCGEGWSGIGIARAFPAATVDGFDLDGPSVDAARVHAEEAGVADRVRFHLGDAAQVATASTYDLVLALECLHDLPDPVAVLRTMRTLVADGGHVVVMDERAPETFTGPGDPVEQLLYGWSALICLPDSLSHPGSVGTGTVMRPSTLRSYAVDAGFADVVTLPIENDLWRFYELVR